MPELKINPDRQIFDAKHTTSDFIKGTVIWTQKNI
jgi:hypothetical protein